MKRFLSQMTLIAMLFFGAFSTISVAADEYSYQPMADLVVKGAVPKIKRSLRVVEKNGYSPYWELLSLDNLTLELIKNHPKTVLFIVNNLGDTVLSLFNIKDYKRLEVQLKKAIRAFDIVNTQEFDDLANQYKEINDLPEKERDYSAMNDIAQKMKNIFVNSGYSAGKYELDSDTLMSFFRRFSVTYGNNRDDGSSVDNQTWEEILETALGIVKIKIETQEKIPLVEINLEGHYTVYPNMERQKIATIKVDTMYSSSDIYIEKINFSSDHVLTDGYLEDCALYYKNVKVSDADDWYYIRDNGMDVYISQDPDKIEKYTLECTTSEDFNGSYIYMYNATFDAEFDYGKKVIESKIDGYTYISIEEFRHTEVLNVSRDIIAQLDPVYDLTEEQYILLKLAKYFVNDSDGGFGDGYYAHINDMYDTYYNHNKTGEVVGKSLTEWIKYFNNLDDNPSRINVELNPQDDSMVIMGEEYVFLDFSIQPIYQDWLKTIIVKINGTASELPYHDIYIADENGNDISSSSAYIGDGKFKFIIDDYAMKYNKKYNFKIMATPTTNENNHGLTTQLEIESVRTDSATRFFDNLVGPEETLYYNGNESGSENNTTKNEETAAMLISTVYTPLLLQ